MFSPITVTTCMGLYFLTVSREYAYGVYQLLHLFLYITTFKEKPVLFVKKIKLQKTNYRSSFYSFLCKHSTQPLLTAQQKLCVYICDQSCPIQNSSDIGFVALFFPFFFTDPKGAIMETRIYTFVPCHIIWAM